MTPATSFVGWSRIWPRPTAGAASSVHVLASSSRGKARQDLASECPFALHCPAPLPQDPETLHLESRQATSIIDLLNTRFSGYMGQSRSVMVGSPSPLQSAAARGAAVTRCQG